MMQKLAFRARNWWDTDGSTGVEYAVLVGFIGIAVAVGAIALGGPIQTLFTNIGNSLSGVASSF